MDPAAVEEWSRSLGAIKSRDVASINLSEFEIYCIAFSRWLDAEKKIKAEGTEIHIRDDKGVIKNVLPSPQIGISQKAYDQMAKARKASGLERARELAAD